MNFQSTNPKTMTFGFKQGAPLLAGQAADASRPKPVMVNRERMDAALATARVMAPQGMSSEEKMAFLMRDHTPAK
ncbi:hypothetical protein [Delftia lacustris]|uniref:hypothetical protein n=1 Tax=Delftia TaxID=80865 RepID=UPI001314C42B|nr:hypothetical protein [Delftia lacustris]